MQLHECAQSVAEAPILLFFCGTVLSGYLIRQRNGFDIWQTIEVLLGKRRTYQRSLAINLAHAGTIVLPLVLWVYLTFDCAAP